MNAMSHRIHFLFLVAGLILVTPAPLRAWQLDDSSLKPVPIPSDFQMIKAEASADLDADGVSETLTLAEGRATIGTGSQVRWQSPQTWSVTQAQVADLNRDRHPEVVLLVWRPFKPWPVDEWLPHGGRIDDFHDNNGWSCHLILIGWNQGAFRELWAGSALAQPVWQFAAVDLTGNGRQSLVTLEGEYEDPASAPARSLKVWAWNGFGFTVVHKLDDSFDRIVPVQTKDGQVLILTD